jgi:hypothetical protein
VAEIASDAAEDGSPVFEMEAALLKSQADARADGAKRLVGQGLGILEDEGCHQLLQLPLSSLAEHQPLLLQSATHRTLGGASPPCKEYKSAGHLVEGISKG